MQIPVRNLYLLLACAWDTLDLTDLTEVGAERAGTPDDLLAHVLVTGCYHVLRRGVDRAYEGHAEETASPRGRIDFQGSMQLVARRTGRLSVEIEELSADTPVNRVVKAAVRTLLRNPELAPDAREALAGVYREFGFASDVPLTVSAVRRVHIHRNNRVYRLLIDIAELVCELAVPSQQGNTLRFRGILDDEKRLRRLFQRLFQRFAYNFLRREQREFAVSADKFGWFGQSVDTVSGIGLPRMQTDIVLRGGNRTLVLDTKFTARPFASFRDATTLRTEHVYQLFTYMVNLRARETAVRQVEGVLVEPSTEEASFDLRWNVSGMPLRVISVNLTADWRALRASLLRVCD